MSEHAGISKDEAMPEIDQWQRRMADELWSIVDSEVAPISFEWRRNADDSVDYGLVDNHPTIGTTALTELVHKLSVRLAYLYEVVNPGWRRVDFTVTPTPDNESYSVKVQITPK